MKQQSVHVLYVVTNTLHSLSLSDHLSMVNTVQQNFGGGFVNWPKYRRQCKYAQMCMYLGVSCATLFQIIPVNYLVFIKPIETN